MSLAIERKLPLILFFVVIILTALGFVLYQYTTSLQNAVDVEKQTQDVVAKLDDTLRLTLDMESALNGFIVTGNDTYLDPYTRAKARMPQNLGALRETLGARPSSAGEFARLEGLIGEFTVQIEQKVERRKIEGFDATVSSLGNVTDRAVGTNIRNSIDRLKTSTLDSLQVREKNLDENFNRTILVLILGCVAGVLALGMANVVVSREIGKRRTAEQALTSANRDLESKIEKRTKEIEEVNESLRTVAEEREILLKNEQAARREAEIANRLRDEFMATVSHELKTPLNSILGWARMLKAGDLDEAQVKKALGTIIKNSETQNRLIEDLLDVARIISGKLVLEFEPIDAADLLHDAIEIVKPSAQSKRIEIVQHTSDEARDALVNGDRNRLMQVFSNLLTNAVKFSNDGGLIEATMTMRDTRLELRIKDNGIGISEEFLPMVFERFRQDTSAGARNGGLGLGLAIVRQLVEMHGGSVSVASEGLDRGSEFTVLLPAQHQGESQL